MDNTEILFNLNNETKKYLDDAFSFADYFLENIEKIPSITKDDILAYSFLLSTLKNDKEFAKIFVSKNVSTERIMGCLGINYNDIVFNLCEDSNYLKDSNISSLISDIDERIKSNNSIKEDIRLYDLKPYQFLDITTEYYYDSINKLCDNLNVNLDNLIIEDLYKKINKMDKEFKKELSYSKTFDFKNIKLLFKNNECFIIFKDGYLFSDCIVDGIFSNKEEKIRTNNINEINESLYSNHLYKVISICGYKGKDLNESIIKKIINHTNYLDSITIKFHDSNNKNDVFNITFSSDKTFDKDSLDTFEKDIKVSDMSNNKQEYNFDVDTPFLNKYGFNLTNDTYIKDPSIKRDDKLREIEKILLYPEKDKSIIITGDAGCGKTALVKGLAYRIQKGLVPTDLKDLKIISIDCASLVAGTKYVGTLEEKMKNILEEASQSKNIILFMDEIHQALGAGASEKDDNTVAELLKPYLDYGRVRVIGATTTEEYNEYLTKDDAFRTRFKKVVLKEPTKDVIYDILDDLIEKYNKFNYSKLLVPYEEREFIINNLIDATSGSHRDFFDKTSNPRLILDIIKEAYANASIDNRCEVTVEDIADALMSEERVYESARKTYCDRLKNISHYNKQKCLVLDINNYLKKK